MSRFAALLGATPARNLEDVLAALTRLRREYDLDDEERAARGSIGNAVNFATLQLIDAMRDYVRPSAEARARERAEDAVDVEAKGYRYTPDQPR